MSTVPNIVHTRWCDPDQHDHDDLDWWCRSTVHTFIAASSTRLDLDAVEVQVERYATRGGGPLAAQVSLSTVRKGGSALSPAEARETARLLLCAADVAEGLAVQW